jgi:hypothetical protein
LCFRLQAFLKISALQVALQRAPAHLGPLGATIAKWRTAGAVAAIAFAPELLSRLSTRVDALLKSARRASQSGQSKHVLPIGDGNSARSQ